MNEIELVGLHEPPSVNAALAIVAETSKVVGEAYFPLLVKGLAEALKARWAMVCSFNSLTPNQVSTLAFWDGGIAENFVYSLTDTPCANVVSGSVCCFPDDIQTLFPLDDMLIDLGAKSYVGTPLSSSDGRVLGLLAVLDDRPISDPEIATEIMNLFSGRAAAELERLATSSLNERLGRIVEASVSEAYVFDEQTYEFELVNRGARENLGYSMEELRRLTPWDLKPEIQKEEFVEIVKPLLSGETSVVEFETVHLRKDGSTYPVAVQLQFFPDAGRVFFASIIDETERKAREEHEKLILNEMNHRAKNVLAVVQVLARQTVRRNPEDFIDRLEARIHALAASHDVLVNNSWKEIPFDELVSSQLGHFNSLIGERIHLVGPPIKIKSNAAQAFGLALHELSTNAAKYGSLSGSAGEIHITWSETLNESSEPTFEMTWQESGGPLVTAPETRGFGSFMIEKSLAMQFNCKVDIDFAESGVRCEFRAPSINVSTSTSSPSAPMAQN